MTARPEDTGGSEHPNLAVVIQVGKLLASGFSTPDEGLFADDFVFHYFNSRLPDLAGDHLGLDGIRRFFERVQAVSDGSFRVEPVSLVPFGDELVAAYVTLTLSVAGTDLEVDALTLWRVFDGQVHEAWDIPAVNTSRTHDTTSAEQAPPS